MRSATSGNDANRAAWGTVMLWVIRIAVIAAVAVCTWAARVQLNPDGVAYLDISDHFLASGLSDPRIGYWSLLYPVLLSAGRALLGTGPEYERQIAHAVNFCAFLVTAAAYDLFLRALWHRVVRSRGSIVAESVVSPTREFAFFAFGYLLLFWMAIQLVDPSLVTPDMLTAASFFAASGIVLSMDRDDATTRAITRDVVLGVALGVVLGLGYLAKAVMFLIALLLLAGVAAHALRRSRSLVPVAIAFIAFAATAAPGVWVASRLAGRPTFGDSGRLNYGWFVSGTPSPWWFTTDVDAPAPLTRPAHLDPVNGISLDTVPRAPLLPRVYDVDMPSLGGTFPLWTDATQWYPHGFRYTLSLRRQQHVVRANLTWFWDHFSTLWLGALIVVVVCGGALRGAWRLEPTLIVPSVGALVLYDLVYVETRYVAPFLVVGILAAVGGAFATTDARRSTAARIARRTALVVATVQAGAAAMHGLDIVRAGQRDDVDGNLARYVVGSLGAGQRVAVIGNPYSAHWARLARARVVAMVPPDEATLFWTGSDSTRTTILDSLRALRVSLVVADRPPAGAQVDTVLWRRVAGARPGTLVYIP